MWTARFASPSASCYPIAYSAGGSRDGEMGEKVPLVLALSFGPLKLIIILYARGRKVRIGNIHDVSPLLHPTPHDNSPVLRPPQQRAQSGREGNTIAEIFSPNRLKASVNSSRGGGRPSSPDVWHSRDDGACLRLPLLLRRRCRCRRHRSCRRHRRRGRRTRRRGEGPTTTTTTTTPRGRRGRGRRRSAASCSSWITTRTRYWHRRRRSSRTSYRRSRRIP